MQLTETKIYNEPCRCLTKNRSIIVRSSTAFMLKTLAAMAIKVYQDSLT